MTDQLGDQPIDPKVREVMQALAKGIDEILNGTERPKLNGFCLMVFPFDGFDGRCNYISNARRADIVTLLKEQLSRFEGMPEQEGKA